MAHSPHKTLELHYPMIQFLIKTNKPLPAEQDCRSIRVFTQNLEQEKRFLERRFWFRLPEQRASCWYTRLLRFRPVSQRDIATVYTGIPGGFPSCCDLPASIVTGI